MVGVWKHGHGNWEAIQQDPTLGLGDKFFLEDAKIKPSAGAEKQRSIPNSIHLVRRADYLTHLLREFDSNLRSHSRNPGASRPAMHKLKSSERPSESPAPSISSTQPKSKRKATPDYSSSSDDESVYESMDEASCKELLRPVKRELKRMKTTDEEMGPQEKLAQLKGCLAVIGPRIE